MKKLNLAKASCAVFAVCIALAIKSPAQTYATVSSFNGYGPASPVTQGTSGNFYGEGTPEGIGVGNTYEVTPSGTMTDLKSLSSPFGGLVQASNGFLYGTDSTGGSGASGDIFKMTQSGTTTTVYSFCVTVCETSSPETAMIQVGSELYGTTPGAVFKMSLGGSLSLVYNWCNPNCNTYIPYPSAVVQGSDGNFYGTTACSTTDCGDGTVFKVTPSGTLTTLHTFSGADGSEPSGGLVQGPSGDFYGVTLTGGNNNSKCAGFNSCGTIFRITPAGTFTTLHKFSESDGANPYGNLVLATDGNFYGTTYQGGSNNSGTIFQMTPTGKITTLYTFCQQEFCLDGGSPRDAMIQATDGSFYGTTFGGGEQALGVVFNLSMGLAPFVQTAPQSDSIGANVIILGNDLTGSTSVTFNGTSAAFTVVSDTEIAATVPSGATTGRVQVATASGTLTSNAVFRVIR